MEHRRGPVVIITVGFAVLVSAAVAASTDTAGDGTETQAAPAYVVVFADGSVAPAKAKPISAFGSLRYVDASGRTRVVPVSKVNLDATRAANAKVPDDPSAGTLSVGGGVTIEATDPGALTGPTPTAGIPRARKTVTVYSATWCPYCTKLKTFLAEHKISARIIEVDRLPAAEQAKVEATMRRLTGRTSFPTVVIDGEARVGYAPSWINAKLSE